MDWDLVFKIKGTPFWVAAKLGFSISTSKPGTSNTMPPRQPPPRSRDSD